MRLTVPRTAAVALGTLAIMNGAATWFHDRFGAGILDFAGGRNGADPRPEGYTPQGAYDLLTAYGADGRRWHLILSLTGDVILPAVTVLFGLVAFGSLTRHARVGRWVLAFPVLYVLADYSENAGVVAMLLNYPDRLDSVATITNVLTSLKSAAIGVCVVAAIILGVLAWLRRPTKSAPATTS